jgi:acetyl esterase/lipase
MWLCCGFDCAADNRTCYAVVAAVGYPLAPEHRFPAGLLGAVEAYDWLVQQLGGSDNIVIGE